MKSLPRVAPGRRSRPGARVSGDGPTGITLTSERGREANPTRGQLALPPIGLSTLAKSQDVPPHPMLEMKIQRSGEGLFAAALRTLLAIALWALLGNVWRPQADNLSGVLVLEKCRYALLRR